MPKTSDLVIKSAIEQQKKNTPHSTVKYFALLFAKESQSLAPSSAEHITRMMLVAFTKEIN